MRTLYKVTAIAMCLAPIGIGLANRDHLSMQWWLGVGTGAGMVFCLFSLLRKP